jgi:hypothetical protein
MIMSKKIGTAINCCEVCGQNFDDVHVCAGDQRLDEHEGHLHSQLIGAQFIDELPNPEPRPYGKRLAEGFGMLAYAGWDDN